MTNFLETLITALQYAWPFREVEQWERGVYYFFGKYWKTVGPGRWPIIPFFMDCAAVSIVPAVVGTPLLSVSLAGGKVLLFSAAATVQVMDSARARNAVDDYAETTQEMLTAVLADKLARAAPERLDPEQRTALLASLRGAINAETTKYGVQVLSIRFTNFVIDARTYRIMTDTALATTGW